MIEARRATPDDAPELVRLRGVMYASFDGDQPPPRPWQDAAERYLRTHLVAPDDSLAAFVVARPGGLASCAVGSIEYRLAGPNNPSGMTGYVFNVATDPDARRRGYGRACMVGLLDWYRRRGVTNGRPRTGSRSTRRSASSARRTRRCACCSPHSGPR